MRNDTGVYQLENGYWAFRLVLDVNGKTKNYRRQTDASGNRLTSKTKAIRAREALLIEVNTRPNKKPVERRTFEEVFSEYCQSGRNDKAYSTIRKQDSLWENHLKRRYSERFVDEITVAEINDYLTELYYVEGKKYSYVESFLKMFYLIFGQAYSRNYLDIDTYNKLCVNKDSRIKMPKRKIDDDDDVVVFTKEQIDSLDDYFEGTTLETAYLIGKYCGVRINECFGLKWDDVDFNEGIINVRRQMLYQKGVIKLVPLKTRNARRSIFLSEPLRNYLLSLKGIIATAETELFEMRHQQQMMIQDIDGNYISSLELINTLPNGKMRTVNSMKRHTRKIRDELDICFRYHYLRHTYGTRLAEMNTPPHILCKQMGHGNINITQQYYLAVSKDGMDALIKNLNQL